MQLEAQIEDESGLPPLPGPIMRRCSACGKANDRERAKYCRDCGRTRQRAWRAIRRAGPKNPNAAVEVVSTTLKPIVREPTEEEREIMRARAYVSSNVRRGKITKKPCAICFNPDLERVGPYHPNPANRMSFMWLCGPCGRSARIATKATIEHSKVRALKQSEYQISLSDFRDRARAAVHLIASLPQEKRDAVKGEIASVYGYFRWPLRATGVLFQDVALYAYRRIIGPIEVSEARAFLVSCGVPLFSEKQECDLPQTCFVD